MEGTTMITPRPPLSPLVRRLPALAAALLILGPPTRLPAQETSPAPPPRGWLFVQMCNTQLGMGGYEHDVRQGFTIVVANTQLWKAPLAGESGKHDPWFRETLAAAGKKGRPIVVVTHYPPFVKEADEKEN